MQVKHFQKYIQCTWIMHRKSTIKALELYQQYSLFVCIVTFIAVLSYLNIESLSLTLDSCLALTQPAYFC